MRSSLFVVLVIAAACGPSIVVMDDGAGDGAADSGTSDSGGSTPGTNTSGPPNPPEPPLPTTGSPGTSTTNDGATDGVTDGGTFDDGEDDTTDDGGHVFILPVDGGVACAPLPGSYSLSCCDVFAQDCPDGEKCMPWANDGGESWNSTRCSPIEDDPASAGEPCTVEGSPFSGLDDCDGESMCFYADPDSLEGTCVPFCEGDPSNAQCPEGNICPIGGDPTLAVCLPECNPLLGCPDDQVCAPYADQLFCAPGIAEAAGYGEVCEFSNACEAGLLCGAPCGDDEFCCTAFCDLSAGDPNPACPDAAMGQTCEPYYVDPPEGFETLGLCLPLE